MSLNLLEVVRAAQIGEATLSAETAGYLVLAAADQLCRTNRQVEPHGILILETGELLMGEGIACTPVGAELSLRLLLGRLLGLCRASHSGLHEVSLRRASSPTLVAELEAALIPVNRAAARRAIARIHRDTERARKKGLLSDLFTARSLLETPLTERATSHSEPVVRRVQRPAVVLVSPSGGNAPFAVKRRPALSISDWRDDEWHRARATTDEVEEHTVRLDQIQLNLQVALRRSRQEMSALDAAEGDSTASKLDPLRAALALLPTDETPFLGSIITGLEADPDPDLTTVENPCASEEEEIERGWDEIASQQASSDLAANASELIAEQASDGLPASVSEAAFSLDIDEPPSSGEIMASELRSADDSVSEPPPEPEEESNEPSRFYTPRKSDLSELLQSFAENSEKSAGDIARQLKQLAGVEAKTNPLRQAVPRSALFKGEGSGSRSRRNRRVLHPKPLD